MFVREWSEEKTSEKENIVYRQVQENVMGGVRRGGARIFGRNVPEVLEETATSLMKTTLIEYSGQKVLLKFSVLKRSWLVERGRMLVGLLLY